MDKYKLEGNNSRDIKKSMHGYISFQSIKSLDKKWMDIACSFKELDVTTDLIFSSKLTLEQKLCTLAENLMSADSSDLPRLGFL